MRKIALKYGFWMFIGFLSFFLFMHLLDLSQHYHLRILNGLIHITAIYLAIREYRRKFTSEFNYLSGVAMGMEASVVGVLAFAMFQLFFLTFNTEFLLGLRESISIGGYLNPYTACLFILMEGIAVGLLGSYIVTRVIDMQFARS